MLTCKLSVTFVCWKLMRESDLTKYLNPMRYNDHVKLGRQLFKARPDPGICQYARSPQHSTHESLTLIILKLTVVVGLHMVKLKTNRKIAYHNRTLHLPNTKHKQQLLHINNRIINCVRVPNFLTLSFELKEQRTLTCILLLESSSGGYQIRQAELT